MGRFRAEMQQVTCRCCILGCTMLALSKTGVAARAAQTTSSNRCAAPGMDVPNADAADVDALLPSVRRVLDEVRSLPPLAGVKADGVGLQLDDADGSGANSGSSDTVHGRPDSGGGVGLVRTRRFSGWAELGCVGGCF